MEVNFGTISIRGLNSFLVPHEFWLLMAGFPDQKQAAIAATNFIVNVKHLADESDVAVIGVRSTAGSQPVIVMSDLNPAGPLMERAIATPEYRAMIAVRKHEKNSPAVDHSKKRSSPQSYSGGKTHFLDKKKGKS